MDVNPTPQAQTAPTAKSGASRFPWKTWLPAGVMLALLWLLIFNQERLEWTVNVVYAYGWAVPALILTGHDVEKIQAALYDRQIAILSKPVRPTELRGVLRDLSREAVTE